MSSLLAQAAPAAAIRRADPADPDAVTIVEPVAAGMALRKGYRRLPDRTIEKLQMPQPARFWFETWRFGSLAEIEAVLTKLRHGRAGLIRGGFVGVERAQEAEDRRLKAVAAKADAEDRIPPHLTRQLFAVDPDAPASVKVIVARRKAIFEEVPRRWVMLDVDAWDDPFWQADPAAAVRAFARLELGPAFEDRPCVVAFSQSAGLSEPHRLKAHLFFRLKAPMGEREWKAWARQRADMLGRPPKIDFATTRTVQIHYVADPMLDGVADPFGAGGPPRVFRLGGSKPEEIDLYVDPRVLASVPALPVHDDLCDSDFEDDKTDAENRRGVVGEFNVRVGVLELMADELREFFEIVDADPAGKSRVTYRAADSGASGGVVVWANRKAWNSHRSDPREGRPASAFDLVQTFLANDDLAMARAFARARLIVRDPVPEEMRHLLPAGEPSPLAVGLASVPGLAAAWCWRDGTEWKALLQAAAGEGLSASLWAVAARELAYTRHDVGTLPREKADSMRDRIVDAIEEAAVAAGGLTDPALKEALGVVEHLDAVLFDSVADRVKKALQRAGFSGVSKATIRAAAKEGRDAAAKARQAAPGAGGPPAAPGADYRATIFYDEHGLHLAVRAAIAMMAKLPPPDSGWGLVLNRGGEYVTIGRATVGGEASAPIARPLSPAALKARLSERARFQTTGKKNDPEPIHPPDDVVKAVKDDGPEHAPVLVGIVTCPTIDPAGRVLTTTGYDRLSGLYLAIERGSYPLPVVPAGAGQPEAAAALAWLRDVVFAEFPFEGEAARDGAVAALVMGICRPFLPIAPMVVVDGTRRSSGKTCLASAIGIIVSGRPPAVSTLSDDDNETRKALLASFRAGHGVILFDNVTRGRSLEAPALAAALSDSIMSDRVLGESRKIEVPTRSLLMATGNQLELRGDAVQRSIVIRLAPNEEQPEGRTFRRPHVLDWMAANRPVIVRAVLTLLSAWHGAGRPVPAGGKATRWKAWQELVRDPILWAGGNDVAELFPPAAEDEAVTGEREVVGALLTVFGEDAIFRAEDVRRQVEMLTAPADERPHPVTGFTRSQAVAVLRERVTLTSTRGDRGVTAKSWGWFLRRHREVVANLGPAADQPFRLDCQNEPTGARYVIRKK